MRPRRLPRKDRVELGLLTVTYGYYLPLVLLVTSDMPDTVVTLSDSFSVVEQCVLLLSVISHERLIRYKNFSHVENIFKIRGNFTSQYLLRS